MLDARDRFERASLEGGPTRLQSSQAERARGIDPPLRSRYRLDEAGQARGVAEVAQAARGLDQAQAVVRSEPQVAGSVGERREHGVVAQAVAARGVPDDVTARVEDHGAPAQGAERDPPSGQERARVELVLRQPGIGLRGEADEPLRVGRLGARVVDIQAVGSHAEQHASRVERQHHEKGPLGEEVAAGSERDGSVVADGH